MHVCVCACACVCVVVMRLGIGSGSRLCVCLSVGLSVCLHLEPELGPIGRGALKLGLPLPHTSQTFFCVCVCGGGGGGKRGGGGGGTIVMADWLSQFLRCLLRACRPTHLGAGWSARRRSPPPGPAPGTPWRGGAARPCPAAGSRRRQSCVMGWVNPVKLLLTCSHC